MSGNYRGWTQKDMFRLRALVKAALVGQGLAAPKNAYPYASSEVWMTVSHRADARDAFVGKAEVAAQNLADHPELRALCEAHGMRPRIQTTCHLPLGGKARTGIHLTLERIA